MKCRDKTMAIKLVIDNVTQLSPRVWKTQLSSRDVETACAADTGSRRGIETVIGTSYASFYPDEKSLAILPDKSILLNQGNSTSVLIIDIKEDETMQTVFPTIQRPAPTGSRFGDQNFLAECDRLLPAEIANLAKALLKEVRQQFPGNLKEGQSRKWVNAESNFMAITIQNRDKSLAIYIKGDPNSFAGQKIDVRRDRPGYCRFKISQSDQLKDAISAVLQSAKQ